jgi:ferredoxin
MSIEPHRVSELGRLRVHVDRERCQGHARCVIAASELFRLDQFGNAREISDGTVPPTRSSRLALLQPLVQNWPLLSSKNGDRDAYAPSCYQLG